MMTAQGDFVGVILAAGKGARMLPFTVQHPKPILPVANKPLLRYQIEMMASLGIRDIIIVIGHLGFEVVKSLGNGQDLGVNLKYVDQGETLGIAHALGRLEPLIHKPFLLFLGDIHFVTEDLSQIFHTFRNEELQGVLLTRIENSKEAIRKNYTILEGEDGLVRRVIEKPRYTQSLIKGCGLYLFDLPIFDAIRRTPRTAMRDEYEITDSIQILIDDGGRVKHLPLVKEDINLTTPADLVSLNVRSLQLAKKPWLVGEGSSLASGCVLEDTVIGNHVTIREPLHLKRCVVFDHSVIESSQQTKLENMIFTPEQHFQALAA